MVASLLLHQPVVDQHAGLLLEDTALVGLDDNGQILNIILALICRHTVVPTGCIGEKYRQPEQTGPAVNMGSKRLGARFFGPFRLEAGSGPPQLLHNGPVLRVLQVDVYAPGYRRTDLVVGFGTWCSECAEWTPRLLRTITDAENEEGASFGAESLQVAVQASLGSSAHAIKKALLAEIQAFVGGAIQFDDVTLMIVTRDA